MLTVLWVVFGGLFAWACSAIAKGKGRDSAVWAVLGFFFGLIALIILACLGDQTERRGLDDGALRKCPHCAETIKAEATKCRFCGSEIVPFSSEDARSASGLCDLCGEAPAVADGRCADHFRVV